jgi:hypothetical protein
MGWGSHDPNPKMAFMDDILSLGYVIIEVYPIGIHILVLLLS